MTEPIAQKPSLIFRITVWAGALVGAAVGRVAGLGLLIPVGGAFLVGVPLYFLTSGRRRQMVPAGALQAGHALWMLFGLALLLRGVIPGPPPADLTLLEPCLFFAGALTVILWPSLIPLSILTAYQAVALAANVLALQQPALPGGLRVALITHVFLRVFGVALMYAAYLGNPAEGSSTPDPRDLNGPGPEDGAGAYTDFKDNLVKIKARRPRLLHDPVIVAAIVALVAFLGSVGIAIVASRPR